MFTDFSKLCTKHPVSSTAFCETPYEPRKNIHTVQTFLSRLFSSEPIDFKVKSNDLWTSLAADVPCVTMAVSNLKAALMTSGGFPGLRHVYRIFMWPCRTRCTNTMPILVEKCTSSAVNNKTLSRISRHFWIYEKIHRGYYMVVRKYKFYFWVVKINY